MTIGNCEFIAKVSIIQFQFNRDKLENEGQTENFALDKDLVEARDLLQHLTL